jgi:hypothetical protein
LWEPFRGSLGCDSPPKSVSKGARFWGFPSCRVRGVLGGISSIPPFRTSFGGIKLGYGLLMICSGLFMDILVQYYLNTTTCYHLNIDILIYMHKL